VRPDVVLFAKGIASGLPLGGIVASRALMERWPTGTHGSTFGGNPVACAAALATLDVLDETGGYRRAEQLGARIVERLRAELGHHPAVRDIRGIGLMVGVELADKATDRRRVRRLPRPRGDRAVLRSRRERPAPGPRRSPSPTTRSTTASTCSWRRSQNASSALARSGSKTCPGRRAPGASGAWPSARRL
jgi:hypothetical protein